MLNVGDKIYIVERKNNVLSRKKEQKVIDGEVWYRYDKPNFEYTIDEATIVGKLIPTVEGKWPANEDGIMEQSIRYHYVLDDRDFGETLYEDEIYMDEDSALYHPNIFITRERAEEYIELMKENDPQ